MTWVAGLEGMDGNTMNRQGDGLGLQHIKVLLLKVSCSVVRGQMARCGWSSRRVCGKF